MTSVSLHCLPLHNAILKSIYWYIDIDIDIDYTTLLYWLKPKFSTHNIHYTVHSWMEPKQILVKSYFSMRNSILRASVTTTLCWSQSLNFMFCCSKWYFQFWQRNHFKLRCQYWYLYLTCLFTVHTKHFTNTQTFDVKPHDYHWNHFETRRKGTF